MRVQQTKVYKYKELSDDAKSRARDWWRNGAFDYEWWADVYDDAERIGLKITSFDLGGRKDIGGHLTTSVQDCCERILREHGKSCDTYALAQAWRGITDEEREESEENSEEFQQALLEEYFSMLDKEWDWLNSDEQVEESIIVNEYEFTEDGKLV